MAVRAESASGYALGLTATSASVWKEKKSNYEDGNTAKQQDITKIEYNISLYCCIVNKLNHIQQQKALKLGMCSKILKL